VWWTGLISRVRTASPCANRAGAGAARSDGPPRASASRTPPAASTLGPIFAGPSDRPAAISSALTIAQSTSSRLSPSNQIS
jgi:hypothetical protein